MKLHRKKKRDETVTRGRGLGLKYKKPSDVGMEVCRKMRELWSHDPELC